MLFIFVFCTSKRCAILAFLPKGLVRVALKIFVVFCFGASRGGRSDGSEASFIMQLQSGKSGECSLQFVATFWFKNMQHQELHTSLNRFCEYSSPHTKALALQHHICPKIDVSEYYDEDATRSIPKCENSCRRPSRLWVRLIHPTRYQPGLKYLPVPL